MQPQENPRRVLLGLHGNSTEGFLLKNLYCLECILASLYTVPSIMCIISATPADVSMLMQLGVDGVFVGSGIFKSSNPKKRAAAMVQAVTHYMDPKVLAEISEDLGEPMVGLSLQMYMINYNRYKR